MKLELQNFMSHDLTTVTFPERGVVLVTGANGSGKSAFVEAVSHALWGRSLRGARWSPWRGDEAGRAQVIVGDLLVRREWTGKGKRLEWAMLGDDAARYDTTTKSQEGLEGIVGTHEVWRRTHVFSSSDAAHFTMATDAERKSLLEELLGLGWFDRALDVCRRDLKTAHSSRGHYLGAHKVASTRAETLRSSLEKLSAALAEIPTTEGVGLKRAQLAAVRGKIGALTQEHHRHGVARSTLLYNLGALGSEAKEMQARLSKLSSDECHACGQEVTLVVRGALQRTVEVALQAAASERADADDTLVDLANELAALAEQLAELRAEEGDLREVIGELERVTGERTRLTVMFEAQQDQVAEADGAIREADQHLATLQVDIAELEACERVLGVRGVRSRLLGETLGGLERRSNQWLDRLSSEIRIRLRSTTERKSGGVVEAISLSVEGAGGESGYVGASAGERRRVDVALLLALSELADTGGDPAWRSPVFFDEVFDSLDGDGREAVGHIVKELARDQCVVVITHDETVAGVEADVRLHVQDGEVR